MTQRFTVDLEMRVVTTATLEVVAEDIRDARLKALAQAAKEDKVWAVEKGPVLVKKITAHPGLKAVP